MPRQIRRMRLRVCLVGERAVGKTSLIRRYAFNQFEDAYSGTLGAKLYLLAYNKQVSVHEYVEAQVGLFDFMGENAPRDAFRDAMFWGTHGYLAVADLTRPATVYALPAWVNAVRYVAGDIPFTILLNKADLAPGGVIPADVGAWLVKTFPGVPVAMTSAKTGAGIARGFQDVFGRVVDGVLSTSLQRQQLNVLAGRVLGFAHKRGSLGVSTNELLAAFKKVDIGALMTEVHALERLGFVSLEQIAPNNYQIRLTVPGEDVVGQSADEVFVIEEPT